MSKRSGKQPRKKKKSSGSSRNSSSSSPSGLRTGLSKRKLRQHGGVVGARRPREIVFGSIGGLEIQEWQRLPRQLLQEWTQKQKRGRPIFRTAKSSFSGEPCDPRLLRGFRQNSGPSDGGKDGGTPELELARGRRKPSSDSHPHQSSAVQSHPPAQDDEKKEKAARQFRVRVILPDPKGQRNRDVQILTMESFPDERLAQEYSALLTLYRVQNPPPSLERIFPEPFASVWKSLRTENPMLRSQSVFLTQTERAQAELQRNTRHRERERKRELRERKIPEIHMNQRNRDFVSEMLRLLQREISSSSSPSAEDGDNKDGEDGDDADDQFTPLERKVFHRLQRKFEFSALQSKAAIMEIQRMQGKRKMTDDGNEENRLLKECLDYLLLITPEEELPKQFDPRGMNPPMYS